MESIDIDWERIGEFLQPYGCMLSGALFGLGWWTLVDAIVYAAVRSHVTVAWYFFAPGIVATLAVLALSLTRREIVQEGSFSDEYEECRTRTWLLAVYMLSVGSVIGSAVILFKCGPEQLSVATCGALNTGFILASGLIFWYSRTSSSSNNYLY